MYIVYKVEYGKQISIYRSTEMSTMHIHQSGKHSSYCMKSAAAVINRFLQRS